MQQRQQPLRKHAKTESNLLKVGITGEYFGDLLILHDDHRCEIDEDHQVLRSLPNIEP